LANLSLTTPLLARFKDVAAGNTAGIADCYRLLHKATLLLARHKITNTANLAWLLAEGPSPGLLDLSLLPVAAAPAEPLLPRWLTVAKWLSLETRFPEPEGVSLRQILSDAARTDGSGAPATPLEELRIAIERLTGWRANDLTTIA